MPKFFLDNLNWFFDGVGVVLGGWLIMVVYRNVTLWRDGNAVFNWLKANTHDEPGKSHKTLFEISNGIRLSEERVQKACLQNKKIFQSIESPGNYSTWRVEPQSVYELRGVLKI
jgi:hypothetical protein